MMYFSLSKIEEYFKNKAAEFMTCIMFVSFFSILFAFIYGDYMVMHQPFLFALMYVWCKLVPDSSVSLWGFPVTSANLPWVLLVLSVVTGGDPFKDLIGMAAGHTYIYIRMILPNSHGYQLLKRPNIWSKYIIELADYYNNRWFNNGANRPRGNIWGMGSGNSAAGSGRVNPNANEEPEV